MYKKYKRMRSGRKGHHFGITSVSYGGTPLTPSSLPPSVPALPAPPSVPALPAPSNGPPYNISAERLAEITSYFSNNLSAYGTVSGFGGNNLNNPGVFNSGIVSGVPIGIAYDLNYPMPVPRPRRPRPVIPVDPHAGQTYVEGIGWFGSGSVYKPGAGPEVELVDEPWAKQAAWFKEQASWLLPLAATLGLTAGALGIGRTIGDGRGVYNPISQVEDGVSRSIPGWRQGDWNLSNPLRRIVGGY